MHHLYLFLMFILGVALSSPSAHRIAQPAAPQVHVRQEATGVRVIIAGASATTWSTVEINGLSIPAQLRVVNIAHNTPALPTITGPWVGHLAPTQRPSPEAHEQPHPDLQALSSTTIPAAPITLLRQGGSRGQQVHVWAVAGVIEHQGELCHLTHLDARIPGATLIDDLQLASASEERPTSAPASNLAAQRQALRVQVHAAGMQRISGAALADLGASRIRFDPAQLQLKRDRLAGALQLLGAEDGRIDAGDELRFYAPDPGDRWNTTDTSWLTYEDKPGRRIAAGQQPKHRPQWTTAASVHPCTGYL